MDGVTAGYVTRPELQVRLNFRLTIAGAPAMSASAAILRRLTEMIIAF